MSNKTQRYWLLAPIAVVLIVGVIGEWKSVTGSHQAPSAANSRTSGDSQPTAQTRGVAQPVANGPPAPTSLSAVSADGDAGIGSGARDDKSPTDRWMVGLTALLVAVGAGQAGLFLWQLRYVRKSVDDAAIAAGAAEDSVKLAKGTAERQLRAYVLIERVEFSFPPDQPNGPWAVHVILKNFGQTPAYFVDAKTERRISQTIPETESLSLSTEAQTVAGTIIAPGHLHTIPLSNFLISGQGEAKYCNVNGHVAYVWGRVDYVDAFGQRHFTKFQMVHHTSDAPQFAVCAVGNETDDTLLSLGASADDRA
jgi:hypothetical protein